MKLKKQVLVLILGVIVIPLVIVTALPLYVWGTSPNRYLMKGYKEIHKMGNLDLSDNDWEALKEQLKKIPLNVETLVYYNSNVIVSSIPELKTGTSISPAELFDFINRTSGQYDYQFQSPLFNSLSQEKEIAPDSKSYRMIVVSRAMSSDNNSRNLPKFVLPLALFLILFEVFVISVIIHISKTITSSITLLEKNTQRIAAGDLDAKIETPKNRRETNEITSLIQNLEILRQSLKDDQDRRTRFIMGISHDLRTPVALIKGYTEALMDGIMENKEMMNKSLGIIKQKAETLENMINDLINYVKLNNTDWRQTLEPVKIAKLLNDFSSSITMTGNVYKRTINTKVEVPSDTKVPMDKALFNRMLENLFSNALRYTKDGDTINFSALQFGQRILISLEDTGIGISEKDLKHICEIFYRGTNSRREAGMGIGLSVVKTIIDVHGWDMDVSSKLGEGTVFTITIPLGRKKKNTEI